MCYILYLNVLISIYFLMNIGFKKQLEYLVPLFRIAKNRMVLDKTEETVVLKILFCTKSI